MRHLDGEQVIRQAFPDVSHETLDRLKAYVELLRHWQKRINLISPATIDEIWHRHILDCFQLVRLVPDARLWVDLGAGAGLPGVVIAILLRETGGHCHLVESNLKKAAFLRQAIITLGVPATLHPVRIEQAVASLPTPDVVSARALAPLVDLIAYSNLLLKKGAIGLFPKGREVELELTAARKSWHFSSMLFPSVTDKNARIVRIAMESVDS